MSEEKIDKSGFRFAVAFLLMLVATVTTSFLASDNAGQRKTVNEVKTMRY